MQDHSFEDHLLRDWKAAGRDRARLFAAALLAAVLMCAAFTAAASWLLVVLHLLKGLGESGGFTVRLFLKGAVFTGVTLSSGWGLWRFRQKLPHSVPEAAEPLDARRLDVVGLVAALAFAAALVLPRLDTYPWAAPDEVHHLQVARNLAVHGLYASGNPDKGFRIFDTYDSVGAPVIVPVAGAFRLLGVGLKPARLVMAAYYVILCLAVYALVKPVWGSAAAAAGLAVMTMGFGSVYLGRTLYGEAPALAFLALGLLAWRKGLEARGAVRWGLAAGIAFGLAILCKSIMVLSAFAFAGALAFDLVSFRRIGWRHVLAPAGGIVLVVGAWWAIQSVAAHDVADAAGNTLAVYQHNLLFGVRSAVHGLAWIAQEPVTALWIAAAMALAVPTIFCRRYDPALVALFLMAILYAFWWVFFTPGRIPRYVWYSYAVGGVFAGIMAWRALHDAADRRRGVFARGLCLAVTLCVAVPAVARVSSEFGRVYALDDMADDAALARCVDALPRETKVATTYWPVAGTLDFLTGRNVPVLAALEAGAGTPTVVVVDARTQEDLLRDRDVIERIGPYAIVAAGE